MLASRSCAASVTCHGSKRQPRSTMPAVVPRRAVSRLRPTMRRDVG
jgi:hypothetical protein